MVVDTNILFTFFWENSVLNKILMCGAIELFTPEYALAELDIHEEEICSKAMISKADFKILKERLCQKVCIVPLKRYSHTLLAVNNMVNDPDDIDFLALAYWLEIPLWSNDSGLKRQYKIVVISTNELLHLPYVLDRMS